MASSRIQLREIRDMDDLSRSADVFLADSKILSNTALRLAILSLKCRSDRPVILLLAPHEVERYAALIELSDRVDYVVKPFSERTLKAHAERLLGGARASSHPSSALERMAEPRTETLEQELEEAMVRARRESQCLCLVVVHRGRDETGSKVSVARLAAAVRDSDFATAASRSNALLHRDDDHCVMLLALDSDRDLKRIARRLQSLVNGRSPRGGCPHIGFSVFPDDADNAEQLLDRARLAARYAGQQSSGSIERYRPCMQRAIENRAHLEERLTRAVQQCDFELAYQPKIDILTGRCAGFEALVRWHDAELGQVSPARFIPLAERMGLVTQISAWVIDHACQQLAAWRAQGFDPHLSINLSGQDIQSPALVGLLHRAIDGYAIPPSALEVEITESVLIEDFDFSRELLNQLKRTGLSIALDDFGTGYSSLGYLRQIPIDTLKLDQSFIRDMMNDWHSAAITSCVITLAQVLGLKVVAEGVECQAQLDMLKEHECNEVQGELFSMPVCPKQATTWLDQVGSQQIPQARTTTQGTTHA